MDDDQITEPVEPTEPVNVPETVPIEPKPAVNQVEVEPQIEQIIVPTPTPVIEPELQSNTEPPITNHQSPVTTYEPTKPPIKFNPVIDGFDPLPASLPEPPITNHPSPITVVPFDVSSLSDADLKAAAALYTKRNQAEISRKGVAKRQETMELNLREIVDYISLNNGSPLPRIAKNTNITLGTTSKYLRQLITSGKVRADGWGKTRRYYLK